MRFLLFTVVLILTFIIATTKRQKSKHTKARPIVGGENADIAKYSYQISVVMLMDRINVGDDDFTDEAIINTTISKDETEIRASHFCGGSIISVDWVLCAAHCLAGSRIKPHLIGIRVGSSITNKGGVIHTVEKIVVHPQFSKVVELDFDIGLIKVKQPFEFGPNVQPIPLNTQRIRPGMIITVTGWGVTTMGGELPEILQKVEIPVTPFWECEWLYGKEKLTENMFCGGRAGHDSCQGDSGGPVVYDGRQIGVVSWGEGCALPGYPGIYTDVAKFRDWIRENSGV